MICNVKEILFSIAIPTYFFLLLLLTYLCSLHRQFLLLLITLECLMDAKVKPRLVTAVGSKYRLLDPGKKHEKEKENAFRQSEKVKA